MWENSTIRIPNVHIYSHADVRISWILHNDTHTHLDDRSILGLEEREITGKFKHKNNCKLKSLKNLLKQKLLI